MRQRRGKLNRRSRAAALWAIGLFVGGQLAIGLLLDYCFPLTRFPSARQVLAVAAAEKRPPAVAFFGSSRTGAAVDSVEANRILAAESGRDPAPRVVTLGVPAGDALSAEFVLDHLLRAGQRPRWAVIEVSPETLNRRNLWMSAHTVRQLTWEHIVTHGPTAYRWHAGRYYAEARLVPVYTHRRQLVAEARSAVRGWFTLPTAGPIGGADGQLDWGSVIGPPDRLSADDVARKSRTDIDRTVRKWLDPFEIAGVSPEALERVLDRCRVEGIRVVLLGIPVCSAHREVITPAIDAQYLGYLDRLCREHDCRFVDARDWVTDTDFLDYLHVRSEAGAKGFTGRLTREVLLKLPLD